MSNDGKAFTYVNQLASSQTDLSKRCEWFDCACCPPNVTRTLGYLGGYLWSFSTDAKNKSAAVDVHLYTSATLQFKVGETKVSIIEKTDWPWDGKVQFNVTADGPSTDLELRLRIPGWATS